MLEIQQKFQIQTAYTVQEVAEKLLAISAIEEIDIFGTRNYYISMLDKHSEYDCPIFCKIYPNKDGVELNFIIGDTDFWAKQKMPIFDQYKFSIGIIAYFYVAYFLGVLTESPLFFIVGIFIAMAIYIILYMPNLVAYMRYKKIRKHYINRLQELFKRAKQIDEEVQDLIAEIGTP